MIDSNEGTTPTAAWPRSRPARSKRGPLHEISRRSIAVVHHTLGRGRPRATSPFRGVRWTIAYVSLLLYTFVIISYRLPIGDVVMAAALIGILVQRDNLVLPRFLVWMLLFVAWCAIGYSRTAYPNLVSPELLQLTKVWLVALAAANTVRSRAQLRFFLVVFLACYALFPIRGAIFNYLIYRQTAGGRMVWNFVFDNPNDLAAITLLPLSMAASLVVSENRGWVRIASLIGTATLTVIIVLSQSRGAFIALVLFGALALLGQRRRARVLLTIGALGAVVALAAPSSVWERMRGLARITDVTQLDEVDPEGSARQRFEIWRVAVTIVAENPLTGVGWGAYALAHNRTAYRPNFAITAHGKRDTHSTLLNVAAETGYPGVLLFLAFLTALGVHVERTRRRARTVMPLQAQQLYYLELGFLAFLVAGFFGSFAKMAFLYLHAALLWATAEICRRELIALARPGPPSVSLPSAPPMRRRLARRRR
ncbi:MAG: O-antigen ligase family protein [Gemmatimonadota bacterium]|nr:O-antigen ligase family protein [Gemmatimonadota bacterium]